MQALVSPCQDVEQVTTEDEVASPGHQVHRREEQCCVRLFKQIPRDEHSRHGREERRRLGQRGLGGSVPQGLGGVSADDRRVAIQDTRTAEHGKRGKKSPRTVTSDSFPGQLSSAYGGALFTFCISKLLFFSIMWHPPDAARLARCPHSLFTGLEYHVFWAAALVTMEDSGPLQTLHTRSLRRGCKSTWRQVALWHP
jgi:hypothetical protein